MDLIDYAILWCIDRHGPLWKKKIHDCISEDISVGDASMQTVGRRVSKMVEEGKLSTMIIKPDEVDRDLIIGFEITDKGRSAQEARRKELTRNVVRENLFNEGEELPRDFLIQLLVDEHGLDEGEEEILREYDIPEIKHLICMEYTEREARTVFNEDEIERFHAPPPSQKVEEFLHK